VNDISYSMLTTTGVIATLISMLFAVAALVIANRRKKHHQAMQHTAAAPAAGQAHPMARTEAPMTFATTPSAPAPAAAPAVMADNQMYDSTRATSSPLFKRLGRVGVEQITSASSDSPSPDEQKSAWE